MNEINQRWNARNNRPLEELADFWRKRALGHYLFQFILSLLSMPNGINKIKCAKVHFVYSGVSLNDSEKLSAKCIVTFLNYYYQNILRITAPSQQWKKKCFLYLSIMYTGNIQNFGFDLHLVLDLMHIFLLGLQNSACCCFLSLVSWCKLLIFEF